MSENTKKNDKKESNKKIQKILEMLKHPTTVGMILLVLSLVVTWKFYSEKIAADFGEERSFVTDLLDKIDQRMIDMRLKLRGNKETPHKIAVLTVDDRSVQNIGRWPWSRDKMGQVIDNTMNLGAKAIGFDSVWSEPQENPIPELVSKLKQTSPNLPSSAQSLLQSELMHNQPDLAFADTVKKWKSKLVMGAFNEETDAAYYNYQDLCLGEAFKLTPSFQIVQTEENPPIVFDEASRFERIDFASAFKPVFDEIMSNKEKEMLQSHFDNKPLSKLNKTELREINSEKLKSVYKYCATWLIDTGDTRDKYLSTFKSKWNELFKEIPELVKDTPEKSIAEFQASFPSIPHPVIQKGAVTSNIPELQTNTAHSAIFNTDPDSDGTIRRKPLIFRVGNNYMPSLAVQTFLVANGYQMHITLQYAPVNLLEETKYRLYVFFAKYAKKEFSFLQPATMKIVQQVKIVNPETEESFEVPVDARGRIRINYAGPQMMYPYISAGDMLNDRPTALVSHRIYEPAANKWIVKEELVNKADFIKDTTFVFGATAMGIFDLRVTPFENIYPGVETHASIIGNLQDRDFLKTLPNEAYYMIAFMFIFGIIFAILLASTGPLWGMISTSVVLGIFHILDNYVIFKHGYLVATVLPATMVLVQYVGLTTYKYLTEERKKKYLKSTFSKYVSPAVVDEILADPDNLELGGRKQRMSVFFSDVRGFTTISEKLDPQTLSKVLNDYLTPMTNLVFANKGTLDKYMGDAIMAFFGAPIIYPDHAAHACRCALQNLEKLKEIQEEFRAQNLPIIDIGIGINTGDMSVGNMGSDTVRNYTVMGDSVNLGSRLEGINKEYGTRIIISEYTYEEVKDQFTCREVDWVRVKGKLQPIRIYELICEGKTSAEKQKMLEHFAAGFALYHKKMWDEAIAEFKKALEALPDDPPSQLYVERCEDYKQEPPPDDWDGVHVMKTK